MQSGRLFTHPALARQRFHQMVQREDSTLDLTEASLVIALEEYPSLDVEFYVDQVGQWSELVRQRLEGSADPERLLSEVNRVLFEEEGFCGEEPLQFDPRSTFLNDVLDRHAGVPIALSIVYIELSRRLGLEASGVSLPGRFLVKIRGPWGELLIDPFDAGSVLTAAECQAILDQSYGGGVRLREHHLRSCSNKQVLARVLSHLKSGFLARHDLPRASSSVERLLMLDEDDPYEVRDRGVMAIQLHRYEDGIASLERYIQLMPHAEDVSRVREEIGWLRAWIDTN